MRQRDGLRNIACLALIGAIASLDACASKKLIPTYGHAPTQIDTTTGVIYSNKFRELISYLTPQIDQLDQCLKIIDGFEKSLNDDDVRSKVAGTPACVKHEEQRAAVSAKVTEAEAEMKSYMTLLPQLSNSWPMLDAFPLFDQTETLLQLYDSMGSLYEIKAKQIRAHPLRANYVETETPKLIDSLRARLEEMNRPPRSAQ